MTCERTAAFAPWKKGGLDEKDSHCELRRSHPRQFGRTCSALRLWQSLRTPSGVNLPKPQSRLRLRSVPYRAYGECPRLPWRPCDWDAYQFTGVPEQISLVGDKHVGLQSSDG